MVVDYQMLRKGVNSLADYQRLQEEFELEKQKAIASTTGQDPAALKLANEYEAAIQSGDIDRANRIAAFSKIYDKNVMQTPDGQYVPLPGLPQALGQLEFGKESGTQQAKDIYEPGRAGAVEGAKLGQQLAYEPQIKGAEKTATLAAEVAAETQKKARQDMTMLGSIERAKALLPQASSGAAQNVMSAGARAIGKSTPRTQADAALEVIAAELVQNVPRFEGPQSNIDVQFYKNAAADVANPNKPYKDRVAALDAIQERIKLRQEQGLLGSGGMAPVDLNAALPPARVPMNAPLSPQNDVQSLIDRYAQ